MYWFNIIFKSFILGRLIEKQTKEKFNEMISVSDINVSNLFIDYLFENLSFKQIRGLAIHLGTISPFRTSKETYAEFISDIYLESWFFETPNELQQTEIINLNGENEHLNIVDEYIEEEVTWYEDREPSYPILEINTNINANNNNLYREIQYDIVILFKCNNETKNESKNVTEIKIKNNEECSICYENKNDNKMVKLNCNHKFCSSCIIKTLETNLKLKNSICKCALCRSEITSFETSKITIYDKLINIVNNYN